MSLTLVLSLVLTAQPSAVALPPFQAGAGDEAIAHLCQQTLSLDLAQQGIAVVEGKGTGSPQEEHLFRCGQDVQACTQALAEQVGVQTFLRGALHDDAAGHHLSLELVDANGRRLSTHTVDSPNDWSLIDDVHRVSRTLTGELAGFTGASLEAHRKQRAWVPWLTGVGGAAMVGGAVLLAVATADASSLAVRHSDALSPPDAFSTAQAGASAQRWGIGLMVAGAAAAGTGLAFYLINRPHPPKVLVSFAGGPGGAGVVVGGVLP